MPPSDTDSVERCKTAIGAQLVPVLRQSEGLRVDTEDWVSEETPVALEFNGVAHAVMLATPCDLEDFALGFGLSEGIFAGTADLFDCEVNTTSHGITVSMTVSSQCFAQLKDRRRTLAGRTGCGICGIESLQQVLRPLSLNTATFQVDGDAVSSAMRALGDRQCLNALTGSMHAAAWCSLSGAVQVVREDVGRHNALDKLLGALAIARTPMQDGFIAVTSRASIEMVQKTASSGAAMLCAISAPTQLAVETAHAAGVTLVGLVRHDDLVIYTHSRRIALSFSNDREREVDCTAITSAHSEVL